MYCFLSSLEGWMLGGLILSVFFLLRSWGRNDKLQDEIKGIRPLHPQDRIKRQANQAPAESKPSSDSGTNPLDWLQPGEVVLDSTQQHVIATSGNEKPDVEPVRSRRPIFDKLLPHLKPMLFALSIVAVWYGFAVWYDNLSRYVPPTGDELGDFRILYLKKTIGALLPLISAVGAALGLLFMINPRYYIYLNGWFPTDYDFYTDLRHLERTDSFRRVLVFSSLFALLFLVSLWVLLHSSPQELTL